MNKEELTESYINSYIVNQGKALLTIMIVLFCAIVSFLGIVFGVVYIINAIANSLGI
jgi:hypothetical protein